MMLWLFAGWRSEFGFSVRWRRDEEEDDVREDLAVDEAIVGNVLSIEGN